MAPPYPNQHPHPAHPPLQPPTPTSTSTPPALLSSPQPRQHPPHPARPPLQPPASTAPPPRLPSSPAPLPPHQHPPPCPPASPARGLLDCSFFSTYGVSPSKESLLLRERDKSLFFIVRAQWGCQWATLASRGPRACLRGDTFGCHKAGGVYPHWERPGLLLNTR